MSEENHEAIVALLPAYALQALDDDETRMIEDHLQACAACRVDLAAYVRVVDQLPFAVPDLAPALELKLRLQERVRATAVTAPVVPATQRASRAGQSFGERLAAALQDIFYRPVWRPVALLLIVGLVASNLYFWQTAEQARTHTDPWQQIMLDEQAAGGTATGIVVISADGEYGTLIVDRLPQLDTQQQYQLWLVRDEERTNGGVFSVHDDGYYSFEIEAPLPLRDYDSFGITVEPAGGSPGPTSPPVLRGEL